MTSIHPFCGSAAAGALQQLYLKRCGSALGIDPAERVACSLHSHRPGRLFEPGQQRLTTSIHHELDIGANTKV
jgi:hypothetical protein